MIKNGLLEDEMDYSFIHVESKEVINQLKRFQQELNGSAQQMDQQKKQLLQMIDYYRDKEHQ